VEKSGSRERLIRAVELLADNRAYGMGNKALAAALGANEATACRDMQILEAAGWAERSGAGGAWRLSPRFGGLAGQIMKGFQAAKLRLSEDEARYASAMQ